MSSNRQHAQRLRNAEIRAEKESQLLDLSDAVTIQYQITCRHCAQNQRAYTEIQGQAVGRFYADGWRVKDGSALCSNCTGNS